MRVIVKNEDDIRKVLSKLNCLDFRKNYYVDIRVVRKDRSLKQNRYYWGVVLKILGDEFGYTQDEIHSILKRKFLVVEAELPEHHKEAYTRSTATLNRKEFEEYLEKIRMWAQVEFNILIPLPNEEIDDIWGELPPLPF